MASVGLDKKYQEEEDVRTLNRAAEIVADRVRLKAALACIRKTRRGMDKMIDVLARANGAGGET